MEIRAWIEKNRDEMVQDVLSLVSIKSISSRESGEDAPFGKGCKEVLSRALSLAKGYGLKTENHENYCGSALLPGKTDRELGIFSHLDVVPEGDGWEICRPYEPIIKDGWIYGRGSADNKGPAVAVLYALRYLKETNYKFQHTIRQFYGCDEENAMKDLEYYLSHLAPPDYSLVPDAAFPVCYGEKGRCTILLKTEVSPDILEFQGGEGKNCIPAHAHIQLAGSSKPMTAQGIFAHAASPEKGENALIKLARQLEEGRFLKGGDEQAVKFLSHALLDPYGTGLGISCEDECSGKLTVSCTVLTLSCCQLYLTLDLRYPVTENFSPIEKNLAQWAGRYGWKIESMEHSPALYQNPDTAVIKDLTRICEAVYERPFIPYCMNGGTYARKLPNAVGYGPGLSWQEKPCKPGHGRGHQPDECICIENLSNAVEIYVKALMMLDETI